ncbi:MAG: sel1 repeat family protein [Ignavibacteriales bacterium]|nr:sel1 repeat family protein [Ignavibacteriales bacterium]
MIFKFFFSFFLFVNIFTFAQNQVKSEVIKKTGLSYRTPLLKPKYPSYNLAETFVLTEKAKAGDPFAQHELGIRYILGVGVPIDSLRAAEWIGLAASKNLPAANFNYGIMLSNGIGVEWNPFKAFKNFKIAAESGMEQAQYIIGLMYTDNLIVNKNMITSVEWLKKSADKGFEEAKKVLDEFKKSGININEDSLETKEEVVQTLPAAKTKSFTLEEYNLDFFDFKEDSLTVDEEKAYLNNILTSKNDELKKILNINTSELTNEIKDTSALGLVDFAANSGSPEALLINAKLLEQGIGIKRNIILAAANYLKAFRLGSFKAAESLLKISRSNNFSTKIREQEKANNPNAMYVWAGLIALGMDYSLTEEEAFDLLKKADKQKHISSIIELGLAYYSGSLVKKDSLKAIEYFEKAVELGSSEAEIRLAYIKISNDKDKDSSKHLEVLKEYSNKGSVLAEAALANCYEHGIVVKKDKAEAAKLYRQAARRGNEAAYNSLRKMYDDLRPEDEEFKIYLN